MSNNFYGNAVTDTEAIEEAVRRTGVERYRFLCSEANTLPAPNGPAEYIQLMHQIANEYPPLAEQASNALGALGRVAGAVLTGSPVMVSEAVYAERTAICKACEHYDAVADKCRVCGCYGLKRRLATERCPLDPPRW